MMAFGKQETIKINIYSFTLILLSLLSVTPFFLFLAIEKPTLFSLSSSLNCITCIVYSMITLLFVKHYLILVDFVVESFHEIQFMFIDF